MGISNSKMQTTIQLVIGIVPIIIAITFLFIRMRASKRPLSQWRILIPPVGMSGGFVIFLYEPTRIQWLWGLSAFLVGALIFSLPLIFTTRYKHISGQVYIQRSPAFLIILLGLIIVRISLHQYIEQFITVEQTGSIFYILAFGMILSWRISMLVYYHRNKVEPLRIFVKKDRSNV